MSRSTAASWLPAILALGGAGDLATGLALLLSPALVLNLLGPPERVDPLAWRWIGIFVAAVGAAWVASWGGRRGRAQRLRGVAAATAWVRGGVAIFLVATLLVAALPPGWGLVAAWDAILAALQVRWLVTGSLPGEA